MSISTKCAEALLWLYKGSNRMGLLDSSFVRSIYVSSYFRYKKYLEDPYARLTRHHSHLFKNGHILDVGANIGYTSFVFSKTIDPAFKIFAFEPEARNIEILKQVSQKYGFSKQLIPIAAAVGNYEGEIELWRNEAHNGDHRILTAELKKQLKGNIKIQKTALLTIDSYLRKLDKPLPISFIKIDVQGYELAVCQGMAETLMQNPKAVIGFEYCPSIIEALGFQPEALLQFFQERDYHFYFLNKNNHLEPYDVRQGSSLLQQKRPHDYIDIFCTQGKLAETAGHLTLSNKSY